MTAWRSSSHHLLVRYPAHDRVAVILAPPPDSTRPAKPARTPPYPRPCNLRACPPMIRTVVARASKRRMTQEACAVEGAGDEGGAAAEVAEGLVNDLGGVELAGGAALGRGGEVLGVRVAPAQQASTSPPCRRAPPSSSTHRRRLVLLAQPPPTR